MTRVFQHLDGATEFPNSDVRNYEQYVNNFDYHRWVPNTKIKLVRVKWYADKHDIVKFDTDEQRDEWFDTLAGEAMTLTTNTYMDPNGSIKLPIPYFTMQKYNYVIVDFGHAYPKTGGTLPLQDDTVPMRYHFFITNIASLAPNTTNCTLQDDLWTNYGNHVNISNMLLKRGHAPLTEVTPEQLLDNPIENSRPLLADDVDYGGEANVITHTDITQLMTGLKYLCLACTFNAAQLFSMSDVKSVAVADTNAAYANDDATVNDFAWGASGVSASNQTAKSTGSITNSNMTFNGTETFAIKADEISGNYFNDLFKYYSGIMHGIKAVFVCAGDMLTSKGDTITVNGVGWTPIKGSRRTVKNITLTPDDFAIPDDVKNISKLYVSPYSQLEITDNMSNTSIINVEDIGTLNVETAVSLAYPIIREAAWINGIGNDTASNTTIRNLSNEEITAKTPNGDVLKALQTFSIPTFTLNVNALDEWRADEYANKVDRARRNAIVDYQNDVTTDNKNQTNTYAANGTIVANQGRTNQLNTDTTNTANDNANDVNDRHVQHLNKLQSLGVDNVNNMTSYQNQRIKADYLVDLGTTAAMMDATNNAMLTNTAAQVAGDAAILVGGAMAGLVTGGVGAVGIAAMGGSAIHAGLTGYSATVGVAKNETQSGIMQNATTAKAGTAVHINEQTRDQTNAYSNAIVTENDDYSTDNKNFRNTLRTDLTNLQNATATANTNATTGTSNANANRSRDNAVDNAKNVLNNARQIVNYDAQSNMNKAPATLGSYTGDGFADEIAQRVMIVKVRTESKSALEQAGRYFQRYGIASNQLYNNPSLVPTKHYCFWQANDMWLSADYMTNNMLESIKEMFLNGVTVWKKPEEIGTVNPNDNL